MFGRRASPSEHYPPATEIEPSPRTRRRTEMADEPTRGRRLFQGLQKPRQGTPHSEGDHQPSPRTSGGAPYQTPSHEKVAKKRGTSMGKRIAWGLGGLAALGGTGAYLLRRRMGRRRVGTRRSSNDRR